MKLSTTVARMLFVMLFGSQKKIIIFLNITLAVFVTGKLRFFYVRTVLSVFARIVSSVAPYKALYCVMQRYTA
jgi:hypothetical protein